MKGWAPGLALKMRSTVIRKWLIRVTHFVAEKINVVSRRINSLQKKLWGKGRGLGERLLWNRIPSHGWGNYFLSFAAIYPGILWQPEPLSLFERQVYRSRPWIISRIELWKKKTSSVNGGALVKFWFLIAADHPERKGIEQTIKTRVKIHKPTTSKLQWAVHQPGSSDSLFVITVSRTETTRHEEILRHSFAVLKASTVDQTRRIFVLICVVKLADILLTWRRVVLFIVVWCTCWAINQAVHCTIQLIQHPSYGQAVSYELAVVSSLSTTKFGVFE